MKRLVLFLCTAFCLTPVLASAADFSIDSSTFMRFQQTAVPGFDKRFLAPATQYLSIDATNVGVDGLALHFYGWGSANLGERVSDESKTDGNLTYFYLSYRIPRTNTLFKAGRFFALDGLAMEQVDGVSFRTDLPMGFTASVYGGVPSHLDYKKDNTGDWIVGGRFSKRFAGVMELGVSALYETGIDSMTTVGTDPALLRSLHNFRQLVGGDIWLSPFRMVEVSGHTYYNTVSSGVAEHSYLLTVTPMKALLLAGDYTEQNPKDYYSTTNIPSLFNPTESEKFRRYGGRVTVVPAKGFEISADYHRYNRETGGSNRYGADLRGSFADNKVRSGLSYHRVEGPHAEPVAGVTPASRYHEVRGYLMYDPRPYVVSFDGIAQLYDRSINGRHNSYEILASAGYRFTPHLLLSGDISYGQNPDLREEVKGLVKLVYNLTMEGKGAHK